MASFVEVLANRSRHTRTVARCLTVLWAGWWVLLGLSSGFSAGVPPAKVLLHLAIPGLIFLLTAAIAWRWEHLGARLLLWEGVLIFAFYPIITWGATTLAGALLVIFTMALPPLLAGILLRENWHRARILRLVANRLL
ncbi:MAG: hypothetical protein ONB48_19145 [candidate division KSB1 bacterium]|nr:hypothetical protein [candidate division KSB1 bacterium]MDZ7287764.1 hypothetical protein [candidate division KSB1 bacterium]MDZ7299896.1 hypothetical protein [candidate division KSB1 bacterium]MDZ7309291.1 hypothetical protein [candidate division KSB1 bacterium]MDZ7350895.1 hypothetical protein [candidate division KSB1 bacterium]